MNAPFKIGDVVDYVTPRAKRTPAAAVDWFVVYTNINCESRARGGLDALGYRTLLPMQRVWRTHARKREAVDRPLFTRYLFVGLGPLDCWHPIRTTHGVEAILADENGRPARVPNAAIDKIATAEASGLFDKTRASVFKPGAIVDVDGGPLGQFVAEVAAADDGKTVEILNKFFGDGWRMRIAVHRVRLSDSQDRTKL